MNLANNMRFLNSSPSFDSLVNDSGMEVAFVGRSNVGKSSIINVLSNQKNLAKTSSTPGKTRHINLFSLNKHADKRLIDLPGYGYAKVNAQELKRWSRELSLYIRERKALQGVVIVMDIRRPLTVLDQQMIQLCLIGGQAIHVLLNKADKIKKNEKIAIVKKLKTDLILLAPRASYSIFSATSKEGLVNFQTILREWLSL